jgi:hypothetical protein
VVQHANTANSKYFGYYEYTMSLVQSDASVVIRAKPEDGHANIILTIKTSRFMESNNRVKHGQILSNYPLQ